jgi:hypothetical protein
MKKDIKPRDIMTQVAFENAMVIVMATGGSTNAGAAEQPSPVARRFVGKPGRLRR